MSAMLNFNKIPYIPWKGKTFNQITTIIQKNAAIISIGSSTQPLLENIFRSRPLKIYRREIASVNNKQCNPRQTLSIDEMNRPNGYIISNPAYNAGLVSTLDINLTTNKYELATPSCNTSMNCISQQNNALKRVRSAGMTPRKFDQSKNNDTYYTSNSQYLNSRNRTFQQNQFNFIRQGDPTAIPGTTAAQHNFYSANGTNHCQSYAISAVIGNNIFRYTWIDDTTTVTVTIPDGFYDLNGLVGILQQAMTSNNHYYIVNSNGSKQFLLNMAFNSFYNKIELQCFSNAKFYSSAIFNSSMYSVPSGVTWNTYSNINVPKFMIPSSFSPVIGFSAANYPASNTSMEQHIIQNTTAKIGQTYVQTHYKPNNPQFSQQGAVSSSTLTARKDFDTITTAGSSFRAPLGSAVANELAYGVPTPGYTLKDRIGYHDIKTPIIMPNGTMKSCSKYITRR